MCVDRRSFLATQLVAGAALAALASHRLDPFSGESSQALLRSLAFDRERARPGQTVGLELHASSATAASVLVALIAEPNELVGRVSFSLSAAQQNVQLQLPRFACQACERQGKTVWLRAAAQGEHGLLLSAPLEVVVDSFVFGL